MTPHHGIRRSSERPIAWYKRTSTAVCWLLVLLAAVGLTLTSSPHPTRERSRRAVSNMSRPAPPHGRTTRRWTPGIAVDAKATAVVFLHGYLAYLYGHAPASHIRDASRELARALEQTQAPPGIKALHPRLVTLAVSPRAPGDAIATALVSDTPVIHYPIRLILREHGSGWRVSGLAGTP